MSSAASGIASMIGKIKGAQIPTIPKIGGAKSGGVGVSMLPARLKPAHIVGGKILKPRIRIKIMQNALKNQLGKVK